MGTPREYARRMRKEPTEAEALLWGMLRRKQLGVRFRRQYPIAGYIVDFDCRRARLAIEVDGGGHAGEQQRRYDEHRDRVLAQHGVRVLRLWNAEVLREPEAALELIWSCLHGAPIPRRSDWVNAY